jgi:hypothetical protein
VLPKNNNGGGGGGGGGAAAAGDVGKGDGQQENEQRRESFAARALEGEECSICLEQVNDEPHFQLPCGHWYRKKSVKDGGSESCPNCREPLPPGPAEEFGRATRLLVRAEKIEDKDKTAAASLCMGAGILLGQAIKEEPSSYRAHVSYGIALCSQGNHAGAVAACCSQGDHAGAAAAHRKSIAIDSNDASSHFNLGLTLYSQGGFAGAAAACQAALAILLLTLKMNLQKGSSMQ